MLAYVQPKSEIFQGINLELRWVLLAKLLESKKSHASVPLSLSSGDISGGQSAIVFYINQVDSAKKKVFCLHLLSILLQGPNSWRIPFVYRFKGQTKTWLLKEHSHNIWEVWFHTYLQTQYCELSWQEDDYPARGRLYIHIIHMCNVPGQGLVRV